jgi:hypothetical protein
MAKISPEMEVFLENIREIKKKYYTCPKYNQRVTIEMCVARPYRLSDYYPYCKKCKRSIPRIPMKKREHRRISMKKLKEDG